VAGEGEGEAVIPSSIDSFFTVDVGDDSGSIGTRRTTWNGRVSVQPDAVRWGMMVFTTTSLVPLGGVPPGGVPLGGVLGTREVRHFGVGVRDGGMVWVRGGC
jgi:hypothetical protein